MKNVIEIIGACQHNLQNVSVSIPKEQLTVVTGPSGSGKSTLTIDCLAAESHYRTQLFAQLSSKLGESDLPARPRLQALRNLPPLISLEKDYWRESAETVASFLSLGEALYTASRQYGSRKCPKCSGTVQASSPEEIQQDIRDHFEQQAVVVAALVTAPFAPQLQPSSTDANELLQYILRKGYSRIRSDSDDIDLDELDSQAEPELFRQLLQSEAACQVVIDRLTIQQDEDARLDEAIAQALEMQRLASSGQGGPQ